MDPNSHGWQLYQVAGRTAAQLEEAITLFKEAMKLRPHDNVPLANCCEALVAAGRAEEAVALAEHESKSAEYRRAAGAHNWLGWHWKAKPETNDAAIEHLKKAISLWPVWALPHANLGHALEAAQKSDEAYEQHGLALRTQDTFDRAFSYERRGAFEARQGWLRNALCSFRAAYDTEKARNGARLSTYAETLAWVSKVLDTAGISVPPPEWEERDSRWQRDCELEIPPGFQQRNAWGEPLAEETIQVELLLRAKRWDDAVKQLEKLRANHYNHFFDAVGFSEKGAKLARDAGAKDAARKLLELTLEAYQWYAAGATSGGEGMERMIDVDRLQAELKKA
ncbi:MAG: hypothetical protein QM723_25925 [Myxococcaceae bacterium]